MTPQHRPMTYEQRLYKNILTYMDAEDISIDDVATRIRNDGEYHVTRRQVHLWFDGCSTDPSVIAAICKALNIALFPIVVPKTKKKKATDHDE